MVLCIVSCSLGPSYCLSKEILLPNKEFYNSVEMYMRILVNSYWHWLFHSDMFNMITTLFSINCGGVCHSHLYYIDPRIIWIEGHLSEPLNSTCCSEQYNCQGKLLRVLSSQVQNISEDGDFITSLGSLFSCVIIFTVKFFTIMFNWNFLNCK